MRIKFESGAYRPHTLFVLAAGRSTMLGGKPVRRAGLPPCVPPLAHLHRMQAGKAAVPASPLTYRKIPCEKSFA